MRPVRSVRLTCLHEDEMRLGSIPGPRSVSLTLRLHSHPWRRRPYPGRPEELKRCANPPAMRAEQYQERIVIRPLDLDVVLAFDVYD